MQHDQYIGARLTTVLSLSSSCIFIPTKSIICLCGILRDEVPDSAPGVEHFYGFGELSYRERLREEKLTKNKGMHIYILNRNFKNHTKWRISLSWMMMIMASQRTTTPLRLQLLDIDQIVIM